MTANLGRSLYQKKSAELYAEFFFGNSAWRNWDTMIVTVSLREPFSAVLLAISQTVCHLRV